MRLSIKTKIIVLCTMFSMVLAILLFLISNLSAVLLSFGDTITINNDVVTELHRLEKSIIDMETGQRGFVITGNDEFLEPFNNANEEFKRIFNYLKHELDSDYLASLEKIGHLRYEWLGAAGKPEIEAKRLVNKSNVSLESIDQMIFEGNGKDLLDKIRMYFDDLFENLQKVDKKDELILTIQIAKDVVDSETGERGFLLAGEDRFLEPYYSGQVSFTQHVAKLKNKLSNDTQNLTLLSNITQFFNQWLVEAARPEIAARVEYEKNPWSMTDVSKLLAKGTGKKIIDQLRLEMDQLLGNLETDVKSKLAESDSKVDFTSRISLVVAVAGILLSLIIAYLIGSSITHSITQLSKGTQIVGDGDLTHRIIVNSRDELEQLANAFNAMTENRQQSREELRESEERFRTTLASIGDGVIATDRDGLVTFMNKVAKELTGWADDGLGQPLEDVFDIVNEYTRLVVENPVAKVIRDGVIVGLANHTALLSRDGTEYSIADSGSPIRDSEGAITGVVLVFQDVSDKKKIEDQLQASQKMEAVGKLASGVAHDFNNIMGIISGQAEFMLSNQVSEDQEKRLNQIINTSIRGSTLTKQLLSFSQKKKYALEGVFLNEIVNSVIYVASRTIKKTVVLNSDLELKLWPVNADVSQIEMILINLIINADHALSKKGEITISSKNITLSEEDVAQYSWTFPAGTYVVLRIEDNGDGMSQEVQDKIYEPFFTTKSGMSTGLGMANVYSMIKNHDGFITYQSELGKGTTFSLYFPVILEENIKEKRPETKLIVANSGEVTVLIAEDEPALLETLQLLLEGLGYDVITAVDGHRAVEIFKKYKEQISVVILDMRMPNMNGAQAFKILRELKPDIPIIISTGFEHDEKIDMIMEAGAVAIINKPYRISELAKCITMAIQE